MSGTSKDGVGGGLARGTGCAREPGAQGPGGFDGADISQGSDSRVGSLAVGIRAIDVLRQQNVSGVRRSERSEKVFTFFRE